MALRTASGFAGSYSGHRLAHTPGAKVADNAYITKTRTARPISAAGRKASKVKDDIQHSKLSAIKSEIDESVSEFVQDDSYGNSVADDSSIVEDSMMEENSATHVRGNARSDSHTRDMGDTGRGNARNDSHTRDVGGTARNDSHTRDVGGTTRNDSHTRDVGGTTAGSTSGRGNVRGDTGGGTTSKRDTQPETSSVPERGTTRGTAPSGDTTRDTAHSGDTVRVESTKDDRDEPIRTAPNSFIKQDSRSNNDKLVDKLTAYLSKVISNPDAIEAMDADVVSHLERSGIGFKRDFCEMDGDRLRLSLTLFSKPLLPIVLELPNEVIRGQYDIKWKAPGADGDASGLVSTDGYMMIDGFTQQGKEKCYRDIQIPLTLTVAHT